MSEKGDCIDQTNYNYVLENRWVLNAEYDSDIKHSLSLCLLHSINKARLKTTF